MSSRQLDSHNYRYSNTSADHVSLKTSPQLLPVPVIGNLNQPREIRKARHQYEGQRKEKSSCVGRLLGKNGKSQKAIIDKGDIGRPIALARGPRPVVPISVAVGRRPVPPKAVSSRRSNQPTVNAQHLGTPREAFHSHPPIQCESVEYLQNAASPNKQRNRRFAVIERREDERGGVVMQEPGPSRLVPPPTSRRQETGYPIERTPEPYRRRESPSPEANEPVSPTVPAIMVSPPEDGDVAHSESADRLCPHEAYKILFRKSERQARMYARVLPLLQLLSESEGGINVNDIGALDVALRKLMDERKQLQEIAHILSSSRQRGYRYTADSRQTITNSEGRGEGRIEENGDIDFNALLQDLNKALSERDRAKHAASHHKRAREALEARIRDLEDELMAYYSRGEDSDYAAVESEDDFEEDYRTNNKSP
ncbi:hypothetical protein F5Y17DRAFT_439136 [Xylariaceae sp. FL0594]|nr:hypothetical protein F5Y17DRAFT_439136 [Xylariaceae sp. FL0594]